MAFQYLCNKLPETKWFDDDLFHGFDDACTAVANDVEWIMCNTK